MREIPLWQDGVAGLDRPSDCLAACDVAIIGGGITGLVAALELRRAGATVQVFEAGAAGAGASGRAFGSIAIGSSSSLSALTSRHGQDNGERLWREASDAAQAFGDYVRQHRLDCDYRVTGHLRLAVQAGHEAGLRADARNWHRLLGDGPGVRLVDGQELRRSVPSGAFRLGLLDEATATIDPFRYVAALLDALSAAGGSYASHCAVQALRRENGGFEVRHARGMTRCREVLVATNGATGDLVPWLRRRIIPVGSYMIATEPLPVPLAAEFDERLRVCSTAFHLKNYFRLDSRGRLIFGGRAKLAASAKAAAVAAELRCAMLGYFPQLEDVRLTHVWGGALGFTFDGMPHLGRHDGMHYAMGCCGRGLPIATLFGRRMAAALTGTPLTDRHAQQDFPSRWYYRKRPWFLPLAAAYYRWRDRPTWHPDCK